MKRILQMLLFLCCCGMSAQGIQDSVRIHFSTGKTELDMGLGDNHRVLESIKEKLLLNADDSVYYRLQKVLVVGGASPEGSISLNRYLSEKRAETLFNYLAQYGTFPDSLRHFSFLGCDWEGLYRLADNDLNLPHRDETLRLLRDIVRDSNSKVPGQTDAVLRLQALREGVPYRYMYRELFPLLRASSMYLWYKEVHLPPFSAHTSLKRCFDMHVPVLEGPEFVVLQPDTVPDEWTRQLHVKTNAVGLAMAIANVAVEVDLAKHWSFTLPVYYSAWDYFKSTRKFRTFCVQPEFRYWFRDGNEGWFLGAHFGFAYYNFAWDDKNRTQDHNRETPSIGGGLAIGYRTHLDKNKRWKMELTVGGGYYDSKYDKFRNEPNGLLISTHEEKWYGVDQASISFAYAFDLKKKGGNR